MIGPVLAAVLAAASSTDTMLDNGLRVVLIPHRANPMVASAVVVGAGVVDEPAKAGGSSHFLEHLLFDGTTTRTQKELYDAVDRIGAYNNATTREDHTLFTLLVASRHAREGLEIQADMLFRSTIPAESFEKERKIVLEELARDRSDPDYGREQALRRFAYAGTPIERPVLGTEESLASITRETVLAYYRQRYVPSNMTLVVMGDFDTAAMLDVVRATFGTAKRGKAPARAPARWPEGPESNVEIAAAASADEVGVDAAFPFDAEPWDKASTAAEILLAAASEGDDAPLGKALAARGIDGPGELSLARRSRPWSTVVFRSAGGSEALDALAEAIRSTRRGGAARGRLERALARTRADAAIARDQIHYFALFRGDRILAAPKGSLAGEADVLRSLGPDDWDAASEKLEGGLAQLRARVVSTGAATSATWRPPAPAAASPSDEALRAGTLDNGLRYVAARSTDSDVVAMHVAFVPRAAAEPEGLDGITDLLHRALVRTSGARDRLDRLGARLRAFDDPSVPFDDYYTTPEFSWLRLEVPQDSWREAVALVGEFVRSPEITPEALDQGRAAMLPLAERRLKSPREVAVTRLDALLSPGHPLTRPPGGRPETLRAITLEALRARHASLATGRGTIVSLVGPMDAGDAVSAIRSAFGALPAGQAPGSTPPVPPGEAGSAQIDLGAPQGYVALGGLLDVPDAERAALSIAVAALSDRLAFELRETRGLAYSVGASLRPWADRWRIDVTMGTRPDNLEAAEAGIREMIAGLRSAPPSADEVVKVAQGLRGRALMRRMTRISLAYEAGIEMLRGEAPGDERRAIEALDRVTADEVRAVIERRWAALVLARVVVR
ncbi:MAG TPA: pitrilysin family protein [Candidatus Polarisedimenticolaceae bacterium]|nr:pitrilysin family protein [Candidatus Polarisedimenticolaceae bacterium]